MASKAFGWWRYILKYVWPPSVLSGVLFLLGEWQRSDMKSKIILSVFFIPAMASVAGLVICVAYFVLFNLPSFLLSVLGWLFLISLFSGGGLFCYDKIKNVRKDASYTDPGDTQNEQDAKKWFDDLKWSKK